MAPRLSRSSIAPGPLRSLKRKKQKRTLDALAIAERQEPDTPRIRQNHLGELEEDGHNVKRRRVEAEEGSDDHADAHSRSQGRQYVHDDADVERGSDSEGNEWQVGQVDADDDSDLDSDEAFGDSDDERFEGFAFRGSSRSHARSRSKSNSKPTKVHEDGINLDEVNIGDALESATSQTDDDLGEDAVDLATALDQWDGSDADDGDGPRQKSYQDSDDDHEGVENDLGSESGFSGFSNDEEEEEDGPDDVIKMRSIISALDPGKSDAAETSSSQKPTEQLTMEDLLSVHNDPSMRKLLRKHSKTTSNRKETQNGKLEAPLPKRQQDRLDRAAATQKAKETLDRWTDTVKHNRRAEHLTFPLRDDRSAALSGRNNLSATADSTPYNELENTVQNILQESGLSSKSKDSQEDQIRAFEQLQTNKMSLAEVQARQAELRKMRDLLFREEVKAKRIKRIKSKAYRRVHRKERERVAQAEREALISAGVDVSDEERERHDRRRAEARMSNKHRNSKWAKDMRQAGRTVWDEDARESVSEMAKRKDELMQRIQGNSIRDGDDGSDLSSDEDVDDDSESQDLDPQGQERRHLQRQLGRLDRGQVDNEPRSKLHAMPFMRKADGARSAQNRQDIERLQRELDGEKSDENLEDGEGPVGRRSFSVTKKTISEPNKEKQTNEFEEDLTSGEDDDTEKQLLHIKDAEPLPEHRKIDRSQIRRDKKKPAESTSLENGDTEVNPWLAGSREKEKTTSQSKLTDQNTRQVNAVEKKRAPKKKSEKSASAAASMKVLTVVEDHPHSEDEDKGKLAPFVIRNQDLVQKAFAGDNVVADFEEEKKEAIADDDEKVIDNTMPGWGSWVGEGISKRERNRASGRFIQKEAGIKASDRQDAKLDRVIISEKRTKKNTKYLAPRLPHPYESQAQYERALRLPMGPEWTTKETFQNMTKPRVMVKQGVIAPMSRPMV
ncbi:MAG: hypothetical protein M1821_006268 [Bathelium mastoideum]|nr:MAG: hypothetical protein M1821_006268 [Bathelium mastoideum]